jgi:cytochrome c oxidase assembly factor CtaG
VDPLPALPVLAGAGAYALRVRTLRRRGRAPAARRQAWFCAGIAVLLAALVPPIDTASDTKFWVHMSQHLLLGDIGPLLIVLGLDGALLRPLLAVGGAWHLRFAAGPVFALSCWILVLSAWHLPGAYDAALHHGWVHALEHFSFFVAGALMWAAVVEPLPGPAWFGTGAKAVYTLVIRAVGAAIASVFIWSNTAFYDGYGVHDQRIGGLIMFTEGGIVTLLVFAWLFLRWSSEAEHRQLLIEQGHDPELARRTARHWPRLRQPPGPPRSAPSRAARDRRSE